MCMHRYIYIYVCMYVICVDICIHIHMTAYMHAYIHTYKQMYMCARAQLISQHVDARQLNILTSQQPITLSLTKVMLD